MMMTFARTSSVVYLVGLIGCASSGKSSPTTSAGTPTWSGSFRQSQSAASSVIGPATTPRGAAYGSINLTPVEGKAGTYKVELTMSAQLDPNTQLAWAIFSGPCGAPLPSVVGLNEFQLIEMTGGGGAVRTTMALPLDPHGTYHVNVYNSSRATDVSNVMMCTNLALSG